RSGPQALPAHRSTCASSSAVSSDAGAGAAGSNPAQPGADQLAAHSIDQRGWRVAAVLWGTEFPYAAAGDAMSGNFYGYTVEKTQERDMFLLLAWSTDGFSIKA